MSYVTVRFGLLLHLISTFVQCQSFPRIIPIAALFRNVEENELRLAFEEAVRFHNTNNASQLFFTIENSGRVMKSDIYDVWNVMEMMCTVAKKGYFYMMGSGDYQAHEAYSSVSQKLNMPFINWATPPTDDLSLYEVTLKPSLTKIIADIIESKGWRNVTYVYDGPEGLINFERLSNYLLNVKKWSLTVRLKELPEIDAKIHTMSYGRTAETAELEAKDLETMTQFFYRLHESHFSYYNHIILDVSNGRKLNLTLKALQEAAIKSRHFHYLIASLELTESDIVGFRPGVINVTGLRLVNQSTYEFWQFISKWRHLDDHYFPSHMSSISADAAIAYDTINVAVNAITKLLSQHSGLFNHSFKRDEMWNYGFPGVYCYPKEDKINQNRPFHTMENGELLAKSLRNVVTSGLTGHIAFDEFGFRKGYQLEMLELLYFGDNVAHSTESKSKWIEGESFVHGSEVLSRRVTKPTSEPSSDDKELVITTVESKPFVIKKKNTEKLSGNDLYEGYCVDLMHLIAQNLSRKFKLHIVKDKKYGNVGRNGEWDGMVGELLREEADMAVAPLTINRQRERVVDFSKPFMTTGISIMIKKPDKQEFSVFSFMQPLSSDVWMYIIFAYIGVSVMIFLVARFSPYEWRVEENVNGNLVVSNDFSLYNCLWFTLAAFMQQGTDILPRSVSGRIGSSAWWFFTMIIVSSYTANLAAFLTLEKMHAPIGSAEDLAKQSKIKYGIQENGSTATFFKESTVNIYQRMWAYMSKEKGVLVKDYDDGIAKVRESKGRYAFLLEATSNEFANTRKPCDTMKVGENLNSLGYGVATKFGSPLRTRINLIILELLEKGELKKLENRWWYEKSQCEQGMTDSQSASLTLSKVAGIFYILIGGMVLSMVAALGEFIYRSRMDAAKNNRGLSGMMQTRLSIPYKPEPDKTSIVAEMDKANESVWR